MTRIAFLGLGAMGSRMAAHLVGDADLVVYNRTPSRADALVAAGARFAATPRDAVRGADLVVSMVTDDAASTALWSDSDVAALHGLSPGTLVLEASTVSPDRIRALNGSVTALGARLLDAPVAGSTPQAEAGALAWLVGGDAADVAEATPWMLRMGGRVVHAGPVGQGAVLKLVVNALFATQVALVAELLAAAEPAGMAPAHLVELLADLPVLSPAARGAAALMVAGDHAPRFPVDLVAKDLAYAGALGATPVVDAARARFVAASEGGHGGENLTVLHALARSAGA